ncbi:MAG: M23 family metallopeptidase, partial [Kiritimatiellae bacterium]|nr:M23 family metallopeptidase [Kiritimatiellia bacterium]
DGMVTSVCRDALWGASIAIQLEDGRSFIHRGLALCYVHEGERVAQGQTIGTLLASIPCEAELGTHLHLETIRDGKIQDPLAVLPER